MRKTIFCMMFAMIVSMALCSCGQFSRTCNSTDSTAVDTVLVDPVVVDSLVADTVAVDTVVAEVAE